MGDGQPLAFGRLGNPPRLQHPPLDHNSVVDKWGI